MPEKKRECKSHLMKRYSKLIFGIGLSIEFVCIALMVVLTVLHSVGRYVFSRPIPGLVEISQLLLVTAILMSGAYTMLVNRHVSISVVVGRFSKKTQAIINTVLFTFSLVIIALAFWQTIIRGINVLEAGKKSIILGIPEYPFIFVVALGWGLLAWAILLSLINAIQTWRTK